MKRLVTTLTALSLVLGGCAHTRNGRGTQAVLGTVAALGVATGAYVILRNRADAARLVHYDAGDPTPAASVADPLVWRTQTIVWGVDRSQGMPPHPTAMPPGEDGLWYFDFPACGQGHIDYLTHTHGPLTGAAGIRIRYRIEMSVGASLRPWTNTAMVSLLTPYFQRRLDNWTGVGLYETFRWYDSQRTVTDLQPGEGTIDARMDDRWTAIETSSSTSAPTAFHAAVADAQALGLVFGGDTGLGHGMCVLGGTARFVMLEYTVQ